MSIGRIHLVMIPSTDHDRSIAFYEGLGFEKRADVPFGDVATSFVMPSTVASSLERIANDEDTNVSNKKK